MKKNCLEPLCFTVYAVIFFLWNLATLTRFPFVHSDEAWLAGLSTAYLRNGSPFVTEPFFDLFPRQPHMIKSLFHGLQAVFIAAFGQGIFSVRLLSLIAAVIALILIHRLIQNRVASSRAALLITILFSLNLQFLYGAHFARQEILMVCILLAALTLYEMTDLPKTLNITLSAALIGLSIGFHPNAFIVAMMLGTLMLYDIFSRVIRPIILLRYVLIIGGFALVYIALSLAGNPNFFADYWTFGSTLSVDDGAADRLTGFISFYIKLFHRISGTYYLPDLRFFFPVALGLVVTATILMVRRSYAESVEQKHQLGRSLALLAGCNLAYLIIGRYNPTAIIFAVPPVYLLLASLVDRTPRYQWIPQGLIIIAVLLSSVQVAEAMVDNEASDYISYQEEISKSLPPDAVVLGNLSSGFAFSDVRFYDIRNLGYLEGMPVSRYISERGINTLIYYEEYDYIHRNPQWQILYGDDSGYYDELKGLIKKNGVLLHHFDDAVYGNRIVRYMGDYPWQVWIYRLNP